MRLGELARVQPGPEFVLHQPARHQGLVPQRRGRTPVFGQELGKRNRGIDVDHRSLLSSSSSPRRSLSGATGFDAGGSPVAGSTGGVNQPARTASASRASARIGLRVSLGGPISATTRSRSVTRTVSPDAASRMYSLSRLLSTFMPTDRMVDKVATSSHLVNYFSVYAIDRKRWKGNRAAGGRGSGRSPLPPAAGRSLGEVSSATCPGSCASRACTSYRVPPDPRHPCWRVWRLPRPALGPTSL